MCRLLVVKSDQLFDPSTHLKRFATISKNSKEYQGHGWGCAYLDESGGWHSYKNITPVWDDNLEQFPKTRLLIGHARSAFQDKGIVIENNMPFSDNRYMFIFNGELRGVKIKEQGRIGAEKVFNFIKRFDNGNMKHALEKGIRIIKERTQHIRGMNVIIVDKDHIYLSTLFNEDNGYFTMHYKEEDQLVVCSDPYEGEHDWKDIPNNTIQVW